MPFISDLSLYATPNSGTTGWTFTGLGVIVYELAHGFVVVGSPVSGQNYGQANAELDRVHVEGLPRIASLFGYNLINAAYYEGGTMASGTLSRKCNAFLSTRRVSL